MFERCSVETRVGRFFSPVQAFPTRYLDEVVGRHPDHSALVVRLGRGIIALASYRRTGPETADIGVLVEDEWQRERLGTSLLVATIEHARGAGVTRLDATVLPGRDHIVRTLRRAVLSMTATFDSGVIAVHATI
jgi:hypothetical protein